MQTGESGEDIGSAADLIAAIDHAVESGADVINMSLGYDTAQLKSDLGGSFAPLDNVLKKAADSGCVILAAAGNDGQDISNNYLASNPYTISVGAIQDDLYTGEYGPIDMSNHGSGLDFVAPGYYIESAFPGNTTRMKTGTSMACPHVAAAAAIVKLAHPDYDMNSVYDVFLKHSVDIEPEGRDDVTGHGYIDISCYDGTEDTGGSGGSGGSSEGSENGGGSGSPSSGGKNDTGSITGKTNRKRPYRVKLGRPRSYRKKILVVWRSQKNVSGYQIRYKFKGQKKYKTFTVKKASSRRAYIKRSRRSWRRRYCYIQVRAFRRVGGAAIYGKWSRRKGLNSD